MLGLLVNTSAVVVGGFAGMLVNRGIPKRFTGAIMTALGLCTMYIGISGALRGENLIVLAISLVLGVAAGTALKLDDRLNSLGKRLEKRFSPSGANSDKPSFSQGFVSGSLLFCVGAMAIVGSINSGLIGDHSIIYAKSTLDLVASIMLAATLGKGVIFSAASVFIYQGAIVLLAQLLRPVLDDPAMIAEMTGVGSLIIVALGLNLIGIAKIKVADFLPAILLAPVVFKLAELLGG
jgi:hypothetical protein